MLPILGKCCLWTPWAGSWVWYLWGDVQILVSILDLAVFFDGLTIASQEILGGQKSFDPTRPSGVYSACSYTDFRPKSISEAVTESGGGIDIHTSAIHLPQEFLTDALVLCTANQSKLNMINCLDVDWQWWAYELSIPYVHWIFIDRTKTMLHEVCIIYTVCCIEDLLRKRTVGFALCHQITIKILWCK